MIIIELTFAQHQYDNHISNRYNEEGLDIGTTEHVVDVSLDSVSVDVQDQSKTVKYQYKEV